MKQEVGSLRLPSFSLFSLVSQLCSMYKQNSDISDSQEENQEHYMSGTSSLGNANLLLTRLPANCGGQIRPMEPPRWSYSHFQPENAHTPRDRSLYQTIQSLQDTDCEQR